MLNAELIVFCKTYSPPPPYKIYGYAAAEGCRCMQAACWHTCIVFEMSYIEHEGENKDLRAGNVVELKILYKNNDARLVVRGGISHFVIRL